MLTVMAAKVCRRAAEIVEIGWCQGSLARDDQGRPMGLNSGELFDPASSHIDAWCLEGAIRTAAHQLGAADRWYEVFQYMGLLFPEPLVQWNDTPGRTVDEVATALRAVAGRLESGVPLRELP